MREVTVSILQDGIYKVTFYDKRGLEVGNWPIDTEGLNALILDWLISGKRPM